MTSVDQQFPSDDTPLENHGHDDQDDGHAGQLEGPGGDRVLPRNSSSNMEFPDSEPELIDELFQGFPERSPSENKIRDFELDVANVRL